MVPHPPLGKDKVWGTTRGGGGCRVGSLSTFPGIAFLFSDICLLQLPMDMLRFHQTQTKECHSSVPRLLDALGAPSDHPRSETKKSH